MVTRTEYAGGGGFGAYLGATYLVAGDAGTRDFAWGFRGTLGLDSLALAATQSRARDRSVGGCALVEAVSVPVFDYGLHVPLTMGFVFEFARDAPQGAMFVISVSAAPSLVYVAGFDEPFGVNPMGVELSLGQVSPRSDAAGVAGLRFSALLLPAVLGSDTWAASLGAGWQWMQ